MKKYLHFLAYASALSLIGCGNSELESKVYEMHSGMITCKKCVIECNEIRDEYNKQKRRYLDDRLKVWLEKRRGYSYMTQSHFLSVEESDYERFHPKPTVVPLVCDIEDVSSRKKMEDLYVVTIEAECPKHGEYEEKHEYSYRNGNCRLIREIWE